MDLKYNTYALVHIARFLQQKEAEKTPNDWNGYTAFVWQADCRQYLARGSERASFSIQNQGPAPCLIANRYFEPSSYTPFFSAAGVPVDNPGLVIPVIFLQTGQSASLDSQAGIFAYSLGYPTVGSLSVLTIVESVYRGYKPGTNHPQKQKGEDGALLDHGRGVLH
jgi:hypothetical protein